jgi:hypothetical protein
MNETNSRGTSMKLSKDTYKEVKTLQFGNVVAKVYIPDLTPAEQERRTREIERAAIQLLKAANKI